MARSTVAETLYRATAAGLSWPLPEDLDDTVPPYSPDLNPIEHDFAALKKNRGYNETASLDEIVKAYQ